MSRPFPRVLAVVLVVLWCGAAALGMARKRAPPSSAVSANLTGLASPDVVRQFIAMVATEGELDKSIWAQETLAEECGQVFESLWDSLNAATNKFGVLAAFAVGELVPPTFNPPHTIGHGIDRREPGGAGPAWSGRQWREFIEAAERAGWELAQMEFR